MGIVGDDHVEQSIFILHTYQRIEKILIAGFRHAGYVNGDILLDIIKEGLMEKRKAIDGYH
ncbi:MAG: hypothetical protein WAW42_00750 [Candidatus Competibacteraceae bacterium]